MNPSLGDKFFAWLQGAWAYAKDQEPLKTILALNARFGAWQQGLSADVTQDLIDGVGAGNSPFGIAFAWALSKFTGKRPSQNATNSVTEIAAMMENPSGYLVAKINQVSASPEVQQAITSLTALVQTQVIAPLTKAANDTQSDPIQSLVGVIAAVAVAKAAMHSVGIGAEILSLGQIKTVDDAMTALSEMFPMGEIASLALRPLIGSAIVPASERFYNKQFRNARLSPQDLAILSHFGAVDRSKFRAEAAEGGFREEDIDLIEALSRNRVQPADSIQARELGQIDDAALLAKLREFRYSDDDALFVVELAERRRHQAWSERLFQIALRQFTNYRIDAAKLADIGRAAGFSPERIDVEVAVAKATIGAQLQDLTIAEIESAYKANVLGDREAVTYLDNIHVDPSGIPILLETWKATKKAGGTHLNAQKLTDAFHIGIITRDQFTAKLLALGWNSDDTRLIIRIAEWQAPLKPRQLSEALVATAFVDGILSRNEAMTRLVDLGFSKEDAATILEIHTILPAAKQKELDKSELAKLFELGVMPEEEVLNRFVRMGYSADDAAMLFVALTTKLPAQKKSKPPKGAP